METNIRQQLASLVGSSPYRFGMKIEFQMEQDRVILNGTAPSWYAKQMIQETIRHVQGEMEIENRLNVGN